MSVNKIISAGFGPGGSFGIPSTIALSGTTTISAGQWYVGANVGGGTVGVQLTAISTANGVTGSYCIGQANNGGFVFSDGASITAIGTATFVLIPIN